MRPFGLAITYSMRTSPQNEASAVTHEKLDRYMGLIVRYFNSFSKGSKSSLLGLLLLTTSGLVFGVDKKPTSTPYNISEGDASGLNVDFSADVNASRKYARTIARMLKEEKFEELDCLADQVRSAKERFPGGMWKIHLLYAGLYEPIQYPVKHATE